MYIKTSAKLALIWGDVFFRDMVTFVECGKKDGLQNGTRVSLEITLKWLMSSFCHFYK